jgi:hypothetical protein
MVLSLSVLSMVCLVTSCSYELNHTHLRLRVELFYGLSCSRLVGVYDHPISQAFIRVNTYATNSPLLHHGIALHQPAGVCRYLSAG